MTTISRSLTIIVLFLFSLSATGVPNGKPYQTDPPKDRKTLEILQSVAKIVIPRADSGDSLCTATLINSSPPAFLSAVHCLDSIRKDGTFTISGYSEKDGKLKENKFRIPTSKTTVLKKPGMENINIRKKFAEIEREFNKEVEEIKKKYTPAQQKEKIRALEKERTKEERELLKDDVAILVLDEGKLTAPKIPDYIKDCPAEKGATRLVAGFGANDTSNPEKAKFTEPGYPLRYGTTRGTYSNGSLIDFYGFNRDYFDGKKLGDEVSVGPGDSGGPTFVKKQDGEYTIASVASFIDEAKLARSPQIQKNTVVDLCHKSNQDFLSQSLTRIKNRNYKPVTRVGMDDGQYKRHEYLGGFGHSTTSTIRLAP